MRKILFIGMFFLLSFANCLAVDSLGLSDSVKGSEARSQIKAAALTSDILYYGSVDPSTTVATSDNVSGLKANSPII
ncbi:hypothetical protein CH352_01645 [Leptospira hartskeerlii]|uniref:Uncharacterized protein n=1 Tax=Leptospira hartskeerlii TaxID=2023177 RepID=A0A2M9XDQ5_9LEPT|nr:TIGR04452 family lipoprotein [Leptospira hartskeerlii]PJZ25826.1 hypothetical protein CH357_09330 [Leptospira hartskeerlii]PJZ35352.1 hypothetical protein CH352_01645 [Leptospira hartskeerlii]